MPLRATPRLPSLFPSGTKQPTGRFPEGTSASNRFVARSDTTGRFPEGTQPVAGRWRPATPPDTGPKGPSPRRGDRFPVRPPIDSSPLARPLGVHRSFYPEPGGVASHHTPATLFVPSSNQTATGRFPGGASASSRFVARSDTTGRFPEGTQPVAGRWRPASPPDRGPKRPSPRRG